MNCREIYVVDNVTMSSGNYEAFNSVKDCADYIGVTSDCIRKTFERVDKPVIKIVNYKNGTDRIFYITYSFSEICDLIW